MLCDDGSLDIIFLGVFAAYFVMLDGFVICSVIRGEIDLLFWVKLLFDVFVGVWLSWTYSEYAMC